MINSEEFSKMIVRERFKSNKFNKKTVQFLLEKIKEEGVNCFIYHAEFYR